MTITIKHISEIELNDLIKKAEEIESNIVLSALLELKQRRAKERGKSNEPN